MTGCHSKNNILMEQIQGVFDYSKYNSEWC